jgi:hypothetical protein
MAETAVGLFEKSAADGVVAALRNSGFPDQGVRVVTPPAGGSVSSETDSPMVDFAAGVSRDLRSMGADEPECEAYMAGIRNGHVLVFATGTLAEANSAMSIMNRYSAVEVREFAGAAPLLPGTKTETPSANNTISAKEDNTRAKTEGARVFTW